MKSKLTIDSSHVSGITLPAHVKSWQVIAYLRACKRSERGVDTDRGTQELEEVLRMQESAVPYLAGLNSLAKVLKYEWKLSSADSRGR